jgi:hypothetical protein
LVDLVQLSIGQFTHPKPKQQVTLQDLCCLSARITSVSKAVSETLRLLSKIMQVINRSKDKEMYSALAINE